MEEGGGGGEGGVSRKRKRKKTMVKGTMHKGKINNNGQRKNALKIPQYKLKIMQAFRIIPRKK